MSMSIMSFLLGGYNPCRTVVNLAEIVPQKDGASTVVQLNEGSHGPVGNTKLLRAVTHGCSRISILVVDDPTGRE